MSTILKALRRLEEDRSLEEAPSLEDHVIGGPAEQPGSSTRMKIVVIVMGGVASAAAGGLAFALWSSSSADAPPSVAAAPTSPPPVFASGRSALAAAPTAGSQRNEALARQKPTARRPIDVAARQPRAATPFDRRMAASRSAARAPESTLPPSRPRQPAAPAPEADVVVSAAHWNDGTDQGPLRGYEAARAARDAAARSAAAEQSDEERFAAFSDGGFSEPTDLDLSSEEQARSGEPSVVARRIPEPEPEPEVRIEFSEDVAVVTLEAAPLPRIDDLNPKPIKLESPLSMQVEESLPVVRRARLPRIEVVRTIWHPQADRRQAEVRTSDGDELLRVGEGDAVGPLVLLEIQPAGVIFDHEGVQIQRRVGDRSGM